MAGWHTNCSVLNRGSRSSLNHGASQSRDNEKRRRVLKTRSSRTRTSHQAGFQPDFIAIGGQSGRDKDRCERWNPVHLSRYLVMRRQSGDSGTKFEHRRGHPVLHQRVLLLLFENSQKNRLYSTRICRLWPAMRGADDVFAAQVHKLSVLINDTR